MPIAKAINKKAGETKKKSPKKSKSVRERVSGDIYGLYPTPDKYTSKRLIKVSFENGNYVDGLER